MKTLKAKDSRPRKGRPVPPGMPVVFYDGQCPLCRREILHYRRLRGADRVQWVDITKDDHLLSAHGLTRERAMARLHVLDAAGQWQSGAWGFAELWSHLPRYQWIARALRMMRIVPFVDLAYRPFARWRVRNRCDDLYCKPAKLSAPRNGHAQPIEDSVSTPSRQVS